ncbi:MAG: VCBS repeat-containing protein, partial [Flavobacteriales bacterium]|nr:VCBS repeat-containing protein [Flavobacteriales bacterium]
GLASSPAVTLTHAIGQFGRSVSSAGDIDSDGYGDVIVGSNGNGAVVFRGGPGGVITTPHQVLTGASVGHDVCTAGDVNGDG